MPAIVTFDKTARVIIEINSGLAVNTLNFDEIYSEWKEWVLADTGNQGAASAIRQISGEPTTETDFAGVIFFMQNGWKIRPAEYNHKLVIVGDVFSDPAGFTVFAFTLGAFNVNTETKVSNLPTFLGSTDLADIWKAHFNKRNVVGNVITIYEDDKIAVFKKFDTDEQFLSVDPQ